MSRALRKQMLTMMNLLDKANRALKVSLTAKRIDGEGIQQLLSECQETAISMGSELEMLYGEGTETVHELEDYCESLYQMTLVLENPEKRRTVLQELTGQVKRTRKLLGELIPDRREVVFLPYKASMWDSLESVWMAAEEDEDCDAYVVPIPYYGNTIMKGMNFRIMCRLPIMRITTSKSVGLIWSLSIIRMINTIM